jgi:hypothetical protein
VRQDLAHKKCVVRSEAARECLAERPELFRSAPRARSARMWGSVVPWTNAPSMARPETPSTWLATEANLMPASAEHLLQTIGLARALLNQRLPIACQVPQLSNRHWRHEASPHEPMLQQLRDPDAVLHVCLPSRHLRDMRRKLGYVVARPRLLNISR